jgi:hypothetical protein
VTPVVHTHIGMVQTVSQDEIYGVGRQPPAPYYNFYTADLTGYAVYTDRWVGSGVKGTVIEDFRTVGEAPMKPGDRRSISLRSPRIASDYEAGAAYRPGMAVAAIYANGETFGDSKVLSAMIDRRRNMLAALTSIGNTLCRLGTQHASIADADTALDRQHSAEDAESPGGKPGRDAAYDSIGKALHARGRLAEGEIIKRTLDLVDKLRSGLADPVKDASGHASIPAAAALGCSYR